MLQMEARLNKITLSSTCIAASCIAFIMCNLFLDQSFQGLDKRTSAVKYKPSVGTASIRGLYKLPSHNERAGKVLEKWTL